MNAIPWYRSPVYIGAVVTILSTLASLAPKTFTALGLTSPDAISHTVDTVFQLIALGAGAFTAYKRSSSTAQPLTLTQTGADIHPATIANDVKAANAMRTAADPTPIQRAP
jgi:hypothetical protein